MLRIKQLIQQVTTKEYFGNGYFFKDLSLEDFEEGNPITDTERKKEQILFEMVLLQKWLRDVKYYHVLVMPTDDYEGANIVKWQYQYICRFDNSIHDDAFSCLCDEKYDTYEEALCEALIAVTA